MTNWRSHRLLEWQLLWLLLLLLLICKSNNLLWPFVVVFFRIKKCEEVVGAGDMMSRGKCKRTFQGVWMRVCVQARLMCVCCFVCVYCCCCSHFAIVSMCVCMWILAYEVILAAACLFFFWVRFLMDFSLVSLSTTCFLAFSVSASYSTTSITEFVWLRHRFRVSSRVFGWLDTVSYVVDCFCWRSVTTHYVSFS